MKVTTVPSRNSAFPINFQMCNTNFKINSRIYHFWFALKVISDSEVPDSKEGILMLLSVQSKLNPNLESGPTLGNFSNK